METRLKIATFGSVVATVVAAVSLAMAPVGATANGFWWHQSNDKFNAKSYVNTEVENKNKADVSTNTNQTAMSGSVDVSRMDDLGGSVTTGNAANKSGSSTSVAASNTHASAAPAPVMPSLPSPESFNGFDDVNLKSVVKTSAENKNKVSVSTNTNQTAMSGSVEVHCIDDANGNLSTGAASNESSSTTTINLSN